MEMSEGGSPVRATWLPYGHQSIDESDIQAVVSALRQDCITRGPSVQAFENAVAEFVGMPHAIAFSSATAALHATYAMLKVEPQRPVITTPNTFAATSNAVLYCGGSVDFQDIDAKTLNLNPASLQNLKNAIAVTAVDYAGNPCDYDSFKKLQKQFGFKLIDDASHSLGGSLNGKPAGSLADISIFSFHPVKGMTTGEGGMVVTRNADEAAFLRKFKDHGITRTDIPGYYRQEFLGYNFHMTDMQAALGVSQLQKLPRWVKRREEIAQKYNEFFTPIESVQIPAVTLGAKSAWHLYPLRLNLQKLKIDRDGFLRGLQAENIGANVHYIPIYFHPYYEEIGFTRGLCPKAEAEYLREISLPIFPTMTEEDISDVCHAVEKLALAFSR